MYVAEVEAPLKTFSRFLTILDYVKKYYLIFISFLNAVCKSIIFHVLFIDFSVGLLLMWPAVNIIHRQCFTWRT